MSEPLPSVLTVAGFDPTGTAGMAVDLRTIAAAGLHGLGVVTVVTAQNTVSFSSATPMSADVVAAQLEAVLDDIVPAATKTAMLWSPEVAEAVADAVGGLRNLVVDPVLVDSSGLRIVEEKVDETLRSRLIPIARIITPNRAEAGLLLGRVVASADEADEAARELCDIGPEAVIVTSGGQAGDAIDVVAIREHGSVSTTAFERTRVEGGPFRGTGDTLSAAVAAGLATGLDAAAAIDVGVRVARAAIDRGCTSGKRRSVGRGRASAVQSHLDWRHAD